MTKTVDAAVFQQMVIHAAAAINAQKQGINDLNVFPVPDGDTGTNMSLTIAAAAQEMKKKRFDSVGAAAGACASALLRGARGNSGVILSLLFRGLAKAIKEKETIDGRDLALALDYGVAAAYKAVMKPAEGTILTVSRMSAARAAGAAREDNCFQSVLEQAIQEGQAALAQTINMNPVLKKAGVVDAGGKGFLVILQGMLDELNGLHMPEDDTPAAPADKAEFSTLGDEEITFTFDTVFIVRKNETTDLDAFRAYLSSIGDCLVIGEDDDAFKVHVHTDIPGAALLEAQKYGVLELAKIENMRTQYEEMAAGKTPQSTDDLDMAEDSFQNYTPVSEETRPAKAAPEKRFGFVAVCAGRGLEDVFRDLGVDAIVGGGQTMNPSTQDIVKAIDATPAEIVYVLPNNKNIIMAAQQAIPLCQDKQVIVIPSKTVPQGIAAMMTVDPDAQAEENTENMTQALAQVRTAEITYAARDSDFGGFAIKQGDYLALEEHQLFGTDRDLKALLERLAKSEAHQGAEFISIFYGEDVDEDQAQQALEVFSTACPEAEVTLLPGGQPVYYYMISAE